MRRVMIFINSLINIIDLILDAENETDLEIRKAFREDLLM
jgi:hypothetical protein